MNCHTSRRRFLQFRLRTLLWLVSVVAVGCGIWQYWEQTYEMRWLDWVTRTHLTPNSEEALVWKALVWNRDAWKSGLIDSMQGKAEYTLHRNERFYRHRTSEHATYWQAYRRRLCWSGGFHDKANRFHYVYLFDSRPRQFGSSAIMCIVTDSEGQLETWDEIAEAPFGFVSASLQEGDPARLDVVVPLMRYQYRITPDEISQIGASLRVEDMPPAAVRFGDPDAGNVNTIWLPTSSSPP